MPLLRLLVLAFALANVAGVLDAVAAVQAIAYAGTGACDDGDRDDVDGCAGGCGSDAPCDDGCPPGCASCPCARGPTAIAPSAAPAFAARPPACVAPHSEVAQATTSPDPHEILRVPIA